MTEEKIKFIIERYEMDLNEAKRFKDIISMLDSSLSYDSKVCVEYISPNVKKALESNGYWVSIDIKRNYNVIRKQFYDRSV